MEPLTQLLRQQRQLTFLLINSPNTGKHEVLSPPISHFRRSANETGLLVLPDPRKNNLVCTHTQLPLKQSAPQAFSTHKLTFKKALAQGHLVYTHVPKPHHSSTKNRPPPPSVHILQDPAHVPANSLLKIYRKCHMEYVFLKLLSVSSKPPMKQEIFEGSICTLHLIICFPYSKQYLVATHVNGESVAAGLLLPNLSSTGLGIQQFHKL